MRDPEYPNTFWVNPFGLCCGRESATWCHINVSIINLIDTVMTASDLIRVDMSGKVVEGGKPGCQTVTEAGAIVG